MKINVRPLSGVLFHPGQENSEKDSFQPYRPPPERAKQYHDNTDYSHVRYGVTPETTTTHGPIVLKRPGGPLRSSIGSTTTMDSIDIDFFREMGLETEKERLVFTVLTPF